MLAAPTANIRSTRKKLRECLVGRVEGNVTLSCFQPRLKTTSTTNMHYLKIFFAQVHRGPRLGAEQTKLRALKNSYSSAISA